MRKPRKPFAALLLSLFPGLGQIYNGQLTKGLIFILIDLLFPVLFGLTGVLLNMSGLMVMLVVAIAFVIYRMEDGYIVAKRLKDYELKAINKWYIYLLVALALIGIRVFLDAPTSTRIQTFKIPTPSMIPTLQPGDRVVAQLNAYKETKIEYGDIVVFNSPKGGIWTFRVIGLPLDSIEIIDGNVSVNGRQNEIKEGKEYLSDDQTVIEFEEELENKKKIKTLRFKNNSFPDARIMARKLIPENEYFLMGDSRDNALDSRFIGTIKKEDILGRVIYTYWGNSSDRINIDLRLE
jgi:signal peptidase I